MKELKAGDRFMFKGFEWVVLDPNPIEKGGVLAMMTSTWNGKEYPFDEDGCNNWKKSSLKRELEKELLPVLGRENLLEHLVNPKADNGSLEYEVDLCQVFILTCDEYRRYREYIPLLPEWMWTCTPWTTTSSFVRLVSLGGSLHNRHANNASGVALACVIKKSLIAPTGAEDEERVLESEKKIQELEDFPEELEKKLSYEEVAKAAIEFDGEYEKELLREYMRRTAEIREQSRKLRGEKEWEE